MLQLLTAEIKFAIDSCLVCIIIANTYKIQNITYTVDST